MRRILITGGSGQVGRELLRREWPSDVQLVSPSRDQLDLLDSDGLSTYVLKGGFKAIVNLAAYTAVDRAESDVLACWKINALAPAALASASHVLGIPILHASTDYVFDGKKTEQYQETDKVGPLSVYGGSKEAGEQAVRTANPNHVIIRTAWIYSEHGSNFVKTMLRIGKEMETVRVVGDQVGSPTSATDLSQAIAQIVLDLIERAEAPRGTYHFTNSGQASWYEFANEIFRFAQASGAKVPSVVPIGTNEYPTPAKRPLNSRLSLQKIQSDYGIYPRDWKFALPEVVSRLVSAK